ncbi:MAG: NRDE family protein [Cyclobacteriaceae bacterium]|nr:NRDE family protein [Cyclobacteriaceae bacterium]
MCLILFALHQHPKYKLVLAANRDEFFDRPTKSAQFWDDSPEILGGRDVASLGTWLATHRNGKFIAITNYRDPKFIDPKATSRGELSYNYLMKDTSLADFTKEIREKRHSYNGFNLLLSDDGFNSMYHYSNVSNHPTNIPAGIHGLSNHLLNTNWPKVEIGKQGLAALMEKEAIKVDDLISILQNDQQAADNLLPGTGISYELEKKLSPVFISMNGYGTRCSTAMLLDRQNKLYFHEVTFDENRRIVSEKNFKMKINH